MTDREAIRQASILVTVLLTDEIITKKEAEILRQALGATNGEWNQDKDKIQAAIRHQGMTLIKTSNGYDLVSLGEIKAQALSLSDQHPAAYLYKYRDGWTTQLRFDGSKPLETKKLYTAPPKREWQGLTDEELRDALRECPKDSVDALRVRWLYAKDFARAIEAKLKEKNT